VSHPALATVDDKAARQEVTENRRYLEALSGRPVRHFAYPYGKENSFSRRDERIVRGSGFYSAVTARKDELSRAAHTPFSLPRIPVGGRYGTKESFTGTISGIKFLSQAARVWRSMTNVACGMATSASAIRKAFAVLLKSATSYSLLATSFWSDY
jgi:peptidoglycan/xylan/chitin deacetylase (PgdA/CDA1 family)